MVQIRPFFAETRVPGVKKGFGGVKALMQLRAV